MLKLQSARRNFKKQRIGAGRKKTFYTGVVYSCGDAGHGRGLAAARSLSPVASSAAVRAAQLRAGCAARCRDYSRSKGRSATMFFLPVVQTINNTGVIPI